MKIHLCVYSNGKYEVPRKALVNLAESFGIFESILEYDREWLEKTDFYLENFDILNDPESKGDGWCLWKPYIISESMKKLNEGEVLLYMDSSDTFFGDIEKFLNGYFRTGDILLTKGGFSNSAYTRRDTFFYMGCDKPKYWNSPQVEAGIIGLKKNKNSLDFLSEYLKFCKDPRIIKGGKNQCGLDNFSNYVDHRYDQSVLSLLSIKFEITPSQKIREYIECNLWESILDSRGEIFEKINNVRDSIAAYSHNSSEKRSFWEREYLFPLLKNTDLVRHFF